MIYKLIEQYANSGLPNGVQVDPQGSMARVHWVHRKMLGYVYIMRAYVY